MLALILGKNLYVGNIYPVINIRFFLLINLLGFGAIVLYNMRFQLVKKASFLSLVDLLYVSFLLLIVVLMLFIVGDIGYYTEAILLLPIIITASILGKMPGLIMATVCSVILFIYKYNPQASIFYTFESNLILMSVMYILGWFIGSQMDLENKYRQELIKIANIDILTGLYNHRYFQEKIKVYFSLVSEQKPLSLLFIDIDYFKHYNDSYGHLAGDQVLSFMGDILQDTVKGKGFSARYGGEEFAVVLPNCDSETALKIAEEIRLKVSQHSFLGGQYQPGGKITISCGVATSPVHAKTIKELIKYADQALYRAKCLNKNKVELYFSVFDNLEVNESEEELLSSIYTLLSVINAKDRYTYGHSERVTEYSIKLAKEIGIGEKEIQLLRYAAFLHDIGKIEIDREILNKTEALSEEEWHILKQHPKWGSDIVKAVKNLQPVANIILQHHENYDGSGYPDGIKGKNIFSLSRIIRVVDSYDAMISNRPYQKIFSIDQVLDELERCSGTLYDPEIAACFIQLIKHEKNEPEVGEDIAVCK